MYHMNLYQQNPLTMREKTNNHKSVSVAMNGTHLVSERSDQTQQTLATYTYETY